LRISYQEKITQRAPSEGPFYGLTFLECRFGQMNVPVRINTPLKLEKYFGRYFTESEVTGGQTDTKNLWMQAYNFLQYSQNLKIFRVGKNTCTPTFTANDLTAVSGAGNANTFINSKNHSQAVSVWNNINNGSDIFLNLNDFSTEQNIPTFGTNQILFVAAKYPGTLGNEIGITIANSGTDLENSYVFKYPSLTVGDASSFGAGDIITGDTTGASGEIKQIIENQIYYELISIVDFSSSETINTATTTVSAKVDEDDVEDKIELSTLFDNTISSTEVGVVITVGNEIKEYKILSLDYTADNFIENMESDYVLFYVNPDITPGSEDVNTVNEVINEQLQFGACDPVTNSEITTQIDSLKANRFGKYQVIFIETGNIDILTKLDETISSESRIFVVNDQSYSGSI